VTSCVVGVRFTDASKRKDVVEWPSCHQVLAHDIDLDVELAQYGTVLVQWYVVHSYEHRLAGSMIEDEFEVCFELLLSVVLAKRCMWTVLVRAYMPVPFLGGTKRLAGSS
jgi:hypothetical protein